GSFVISGENFDVWAELLTVQVDPFVVIERITFLVLKLPTGAAEPLQVATVGIPQHSPHGDARLFCAIPNTAEDRKSTRLNSSHVKISYAVFCLKKKNK